MAQAAVPKAAAVPQASNQSFEQIIKAAANATKFGGNNDLWAGVANTGIHYLSATHGAQSYSASALTGGR